MLGACREPDPAINPGVSLGLAIGTLAQAGRDKLTFLADDEIASVRGVGRAAHRREHRQARRRDRPGRPRAARRPSSRYGAGPRVRPHRPRGRATTAAATRCADALEAAGHPVIRIDARRPDRPRRRVRPLGGRDGDRRGRPRHRPVRPAERRGGQAADPRPARQGRARRGGAGRSSRSRRRRADPVRRRAAPAHRGRRRRRRRAGPPPRPPHGRTPTSRSRRSSPRRRSATRRSPGSAPCCATRTGRATTAGYGPRFLHSTGQLHKGGPPIGWFLQLTADHPVDRPIPGWPYTFGQLIDAQAAGDFAAIEAHDLPILRVHLGADPDAGLAALERALDRRARPRPRRADRHAHRVHRPRPDGGQHGPPPRPRRPRDRRLQPDARRRRRRSSRARARSAAFSIAELVAALEQPRAVWIMVPAGDATEAQIDELLEHLEPGDTIIDGGNTNFHDDVRRHADAQGQGHPATSTPGRQRRDLGPPGRLLPDGRWRRGGGRRRSSRSSRSLAPAGRLPPRRRARAPATT